MSDKLQWIFARDRLYAKQTSATKTDW